MHGAVIGHVSDEQVEWNISLFGKLELPLAA